MRGTGFPSGKLCPILARLEAAGWLIKEFEQVDPASIGRPVCRSYWLIGKGAKAARGELALVNAQLPPHAKGSAAPQPVAGA